MRLKTFNSGPYWIMVKKLFLFVFLLFLACGGYTAYNFHPDILPKKAKKLKYNLVDIDVKLPQKTQLPPAYSAPIAPNWERALEDSLLELGIFSLESDEYITLKVKVIEMDFGFASEKIGIKATYTLRNIKTKEIIIEKTILSQGEASDFSGTERGTKSLNNSVKNNITSFLLFLSENL